MRARVLWATSAGPDRGKTSAVFPPSLVLPSALRACVELGARATRPSCGTEPYSLGTCPSSRGPPFLQFSFSVSCFRSSLSVLLVSEAFRRTCQGPPLLQSPYCKPGTVPRVTFVGGASVVVCLISFPLPPSLPSSPVVPGTTDSNCLPGLSTCHDSCRTQPCSPHVSFSCVSPPLLLPLPLVPISTLCQAHCRFCLLLVG